MSPFCFFCILHSNWKLSISPDLNSWRNESCLRQRRLIFEYNKKKSFFSYPFFLIILTINLNSFLTTHNFFYRVKNSLPHSLSLYSSSIWLSYFSLAVCARRWNSKNTTKNSESTFHHIFQCLIPLHHLALKIQFPNFPRTEKFSSISARKVHTQKNYWIIAKQLFAWRSPDEVPRVSD